MRHRLPGTRRRLARRAAAAAQTDHGHAGRQRTAEQGQALPRTAEDQPAPERPRLEQGHPPVRLRYRRDGPGLRGGRRSRRMATQLPGTGAGSARSHPPGRRAAGDGRQGRRAAPARGPDQPLRDRPPQRRIPCADRRAQPQRRPAPAARPAPGGIEGLAVGPPAGRPAAVLPHRLQCRRIARQPQAPAAAPLLHRLQPQGPRR
ncbi:hypothetical protein D3C76_1185540 [compost metagenome]